MKALLIDHNDSFTQNLKHWLKPIFQDIVVINCAELREIKSATSDLKKLEQQFNLFVLSPGPKSPQDYPHSLDLLNHISANMPVFGVCLGLQMMAISAGLNVSTYTPPLHGKTSQLKALDASVQDFENHLVARYHSIQVNISDNFSKDDSNPFQVLAESTNDGIPMWLRHKSKKWAGVQFHPESFLTEAPEKHLQHLQRWLQT